MRSKTHLYHYAWLHAETLLGVRCVCWQGAWWAGTWSKWTTNTTASHAGHSTISSSEAGYASLRRQSHLLRSFAWRTV